MTDARTAATLLQLIWLASPALPVGGFSYSEGLESAVDSGRVCGEAQAGDWLLDQLRLSLAQADLAVAAQAIEAWSRGDAARVAELNDWSLTTRESAELRRQTEQMGRSLLEWMKNRDPDPRIGMLAALRPAPAWPVAFALAAAQAGASARDALLAFAFGWAENMAQAAIKSVPLGQNAGQRILARLAQAIPEAVEHALALPDHARQSFTPMLAVLSARHETQYSRLFRS
ncbi:MAG TPA: urease accessory UreF family protein [Quisquiliibacterium sp.]|nr:urease accessory UreF family protein [Quisquiliibacterium sp.]